MIALEKVLEVRRLLDEGKLSRRKIARLTGVSRGTVNAIANGERGLFGATAADAADRLTPQRTTIASRCPGCGGLVYLPCVYCQAQRYMATEPDERPSKAA